MGKDAKCPKCGSFLNSMGTCLACHPQGRVREPKKPSSGNNKSNKKSWP